MLTMGIVSAEGLAENLAQAPVAGALPGIAGIGTFAYLIYQTLIEKKQAFMESMTGMKALVVIGLMLALTMIPAATLVLFGPAQPLMTAILEIAMVGLIGYVFAVVVYQFVARFAPEYLGT